MNENNELNRLLNSLIQYGVSVKLG